jgi:uncharacterized protein (TIGR04255 family)
MYEDICYKKSYLTEVVARIDFATPITGFEKTLSSKLVKKISKHFPIIEPVETVGHQFQIGDGDIKKTEMHAKQWNFFGKEREKQLVISNNFVFARYTIYSKYEALNDEFREAINAIDQEQPGAVAQRIGLRYINNFEIEGIKITEWDRLISGKLLGTLTFFENTAHLTRLFHIAELKFDDIDVRFQFGFPNQDYPAIIKRPIFVIDIDAYAQVTHAITESLQYMDDAHGHIQKLFENSITDELRSKMNA